MPMSAMFHFNWIYVIDKIKMQNKISKVNENNES